MSTKQPELLERKREAHKAIMDVVDRAISQIDQEIRELQAAANEETKSSAGDKYETGRAMAQLEIEKLLQQRHDRLAIQNLLRSISLDRLHESVQLGAMVETSRGNFYLTANAGEIRIGSFQFLTLSIKSPLGQLMMGRKSGDIFEWNKTSVVIHHVS